MKEIKLTKGKVALVDDEDFELLNKFKWNVSCVGNINKVWYAQRQFRKGGKKYTVLMHRQIMNVTNSNVLIDHEDHNGLNNQKYNLRKATFKQNIRNRRSYVGSTSKYLGVSFSSARQKWVATIRKGENRLFLGRFVKEEDAAIKYNIAAKKMYGKFANQNVLK